MVLEKFVADFLCLVIFVFLFLIIMRLALTCLFFFLFPNQCSVIPVELSANWEILVVTVL